MKMNLSRRLERLEERTHAAAAISSSPRRILFVDPIKGLTDRCKWRSGAIRVALKLLNSSCGFQSSTVKRIGDGGLAGVGAVGIVPYIETKCCRLRKTTHAKSGAQDAQNLLSR